MGKIKLTTSSDKSITVVSNIFIDQFMPEANGTYVKVYLYLLRCLSDTEPNISIAAIADKLDETEKDILRALRYWERAGVIQLVKNEDEIIADIILLDLVTRTSALRPPAAAGTAAHEPVIDTAGLNDMEDTEVTAVPEETIAFPAPLPVQAFRADSVLDSMITFRPAEKPDYSAAQINQLTDIEEVKKLLDDVESSLARPLKQQEIQLVLYFYESVGMTPELISYLYSYCVSLNKKSSSYIEKVAHAWVSKDILTVEQAQESTLYYHSSYRCIAKAFGLTRMPGAAEYQFIEYWFKTLKFDEAMVSEACSRSLLATGKPDFKYANRILENWHKKDAKTPEAIAKLDELHIKLQKVSQEAKRPVYPPRQANTNKFNRFPQREYTEETVTSLEQRFLNRG